MDSGTRQTPLVDRATGLGLSTAGLAVLAMMFIETADVIATRFGRPIAGAHELVEMLMVLVIFLALPHVEARRQHIAVDLVLPKLPAAVQRMAGVLGQLLAVVFFGAMAWQGWKLFWESWKIREYASGSVAFPIYPSKALFAFGVTVAAIVALVNLVRSLRNAAPRGSAAPADT